MSPLYLTTQARNAALIAAAQRLAESCGCMAAFVMADGEQEERERAEQAQLQLDLRKPS